MKFNLKTPQIRRNIARTCGIVQRNFSFINSNSRDFVDVGTRALDPEFPRERKRKLLRFSQAASRRTLPTDVLHPLQMKPYNVDGITILLDIVQIISIRGQSIGTEK